MSELLAVRPDSDARLMTAEEMTGYHGLGGVSQSGLKKYLKNPNKFWRQHVKVPVDPPDPPSAAFQFGKDIEEFLFDNCVPRDAKLIPESALGSKRSKRNLAGETNWSDWLSENNLDPKKHILLKKEEWDEHLGPMVRVRENIMKHDRAKKLLFGSHNERKIGIFGKCPYTGFGTRGELDIFSSLGFICDLKSSKETRKSGFEKEIWKFGYHIQASWYQNLVFQLTGEKLPFVFIVVGNNGDHLVETYDLDSSWFDLASPVIERGMIALAKSYETGSWNTRTHNRLVSLEPKNWMKKQVWEDET